MMLALVAMLIEVIDLKLDLSDRYVHRGVLLRKCHFLSLCITVPEKLDLLSPVH